MRPRCPAESTLRFRWGPTGKSWPIQNDRTATGLKVGLSILVYRRSRSALERLNMRFPNQLRTLPAILFCYLVALAPASAQSTWHVEKTMQVDGAGVMDYITI